jgi:hypothetical protein
MNFSMDFDASAEIHYRTVSPFNPGRGRERMNLGLHFVGQKVLWASPPLEQRARKAHAEPNVQ